MKFNVFLNEYRLPAEWEQHESTWLTWPHNTDTWEHQLKDTQKAYIKFIHSISKGEKVNIILTQNNISEVRDKLKKANTNLNQIIFHQWETNDSWIRDYGPDFLIGTKDKIILNWKYNAWGQKYPPFDADNSIPLKIAEYLKLKHYSPDIVLEGGSFEPNGKGTILTTTNCLLNKNRNPHLTQKQIQSILEEYLQINNIIWLKDGIIGDDTDGHVDDISRFVNKNTILTCIEQNKQDENYTPLQKNLKLLNTARLENGKQANIVELPMPAPFFFKNQRLPASYANFYICNQAVIVPIFNDSNDDKAIQILESLFYDRKIIPIYSGDIIYGLGSFHCLSKHEPKHIN